MNRWEVMNCDYAPFDLPSLTGQKIGSLPEPWLARPIVNPGNYGEWFATHAEAITYADKQARRTA